MTGVVQLVFVTVPSRAGAEAIARALVEERLAACVNIIPGLTSVYRWQGQVHSDSETLLLAKTEAGVFPRLQERVQALHEAELPEIVAVGIEQGLPGYLDWVRQQMGDAGE